MRIGAIAPPVFSQSIEPGFTENQQASQIGQGLIAHPEIAITASARLDEVTNASSSPIKRPMSSAKLANTGQAEANPAPATRGQKRYRQWGWGACGCAGLLFSLLVLLILFVIFDPLKFHLWGRLTGAYDAAAEVMPPETDMYLGINLGNALLTRLDRSIAPFMTAGQAGFNPSHIDYRPTPVNSARGQPAGLLDDFLRQVEVETGVKIPDDISPWVGQYAGAGVIDIQTSSYGEPYPRGWIIAAEVRNIRRADAFLRTLQENLTELQDLSFVTQSYNGSLIVTQDLSESQSALSFTRSGRMLILASGLDILKNAIDMQGKVSLSHQADYDRFASSRPRDWFASLYIDMEGLGELFDELLRSSDLSSAMPLVNPYSLLKQQGMSLSAVAIKNGLRLDVYMTSDAANLPPAMDTQTVDIYTHPDQVVGLLPHDTVLFLANPSFELYWKSTVQQGLGDESDYEYMLKAFEQTYGFSLQEDLLNYMNGQFALYAVPSTQGILPEQMDLDFAVNLVVQTEGDIDFQSIADKMNTAGFPGGFTVDDQELDGITYHQLRDYASGSPIIAFGGNEKMAVFGTDLNSVQAQFSSGDLLVNTSHYRAAVSAFSYGMKPMMYVDLHALLANIREGMSGSELQSFNSNINIIEPIDVVALSGRLAEPGLMHSSIVFIVVDK